MIQDRQTKLSCSVKHHDGITKRHLVVPQLSLTESEISKIGSIKVEGIINPTNAEMDLKEGVGEEY